MGTIVKIVIVTMLLLRRFDNKGELDSSAYNNNKEGLINKVN